MKTDIFLLPETELILETVGSRIRLARLRRNMPSRVLAEKAGISRATLWQIEKGKPTVSIGAYVKCLASLDLAESFLCVAKDDLVGRTIQDSRLKKAGWSSK